MTSKDKIAIGRKVHNIDYISLYESLHHVGDDPVKAEIEDALKELLNPQQYSIVCAVFDWATKENR